MGIYDLIQQVPTGETAEEKQWFQEILARRRAVLLQKKAVDQFISECSDSFFLNYEKSGEVKPDNALIENLTVFIRREFKRRRLTV